MKSIEFISHSRLKMTAGPGQKSSEVWSDIADGFLKAANNSEVETRISGPMSYHDNEEYINLVAAAINRKPDAIVLPFSPSGKAREKFTNVLEGYDGNIVAVNVPPSPEQKKILGKRLLGYTGMNEFAAGETAARELIFRKWENKIMHILVLVHEKNHSGLELRVEGVKHGVKNYGFNPDVRAVYVDPKKQKVAIPKRWLMKDENFGVITLGIRGTEAALISSPIKPFGIVSIDLDNDVKQAILNNSIACTLIQHPREEGMIAMKIALNPGNEFAELFCGPTIVDKNNVHVFA